MAGPGAGTKGHGTSSGDGAWLPLSWEDHAKGAVINPSGGRRQKGSGISRLLRNGAKKVPASRCRAPYLFLALLTGKHWLSIPCARRALEPGALGA
jgi:hypothetical protein